MKSTTTHHSEEVKKTPKIDFLSLINTYAKAFNLSENYQCKASLSLFSSLSSQLQDRQPWILTQIGRLYYEMNDYVSAEKTFKKLLLLQPFAIQHMSLYGTCLWQLRKLKELSFLAKELEVCHPTSAETW